MNLTVKAHYLNSSPTLLRSDSRKTNSHFTLASMIPIILLVFAACEAALGLSLLVTVSNTYGTDYGRKDPGHYQAFKRYGIALVAK